MVVTMYFLNERSPLKNEERGGEGRYWELLYVLMWVSLCPLLASRRKQSHQGPYPCPFTKVVGRFQNGFFRPLNNVF